MDDIVDRLRDHQNGGRRAECEEAANQIEALRDMLDSARADMEMLREAIGVPAEPHQSLLERMVEAAQAKRGAVPEGYDIAPTFRGYAALGSGQYVLHNCPRTDEDHPSLVIAIATEEEKADRQVGELRHVTPGLMIQPDRIAVRLDFENAAALDALEQQLRFLREDSFPDSLATPAPYHFRGAAEKVPEGDDGKRVLREVFALCEDTESKCSEETSDFARGRRFEAKGIARAIGAWYQEEFCGRTHMGEPAAPAPAPADDASLSKCQARLFDVLVGDDGQAWAEAERYLETARPDLFATLRREAKPAKCDGNHGGPRCADPECWQDPAGAVIDVRTEAERLVKSALAVGVVLTIETQPRQPLAMGHYDVVVETREARKGGAE